MIGAGRNPLKVSQRPIRSSNRNSGISGMKPAVEVCPNR